MNEPILTNSAAPPPPLARTPVYVGLDRIQVDFPDGWWDHPTHDLVLQDGGTVRAHRINELALGIAAALRQQLAARRPASGLVGPDGRPLE